MPIPRQDLSPPTLGTTQYLPKMKPIRIGNLYGEQFKTGFAGNVWNRNGIAPALMTMQGGGREPMILEYGQGDRVGKHRDNAELEKSAER